MTNKELNKQFNIPSWVKGNTPAEEADSIKRKFQDRESKPEQETMEELLQSVADKQEYVKIERGLVSQSDQVPDMMYGEIPPGMEQFNNGGAAAHAAQGADAASQVAMLGATPIGLAVEAGKNAVTGIADLALAFGPSQVDTSGATRYGEDDFKSGGQQYLEKLQSDPLQALNPMTAISTFIGAGKDKQAMQKAMTNEALKTNLAYSKKHLGGGIPWHPHPHGEGSVGSITPSGYDLGDPLRRGQRNFLPANRGPRGTGYTPNIPGSLTPGFGKYKPSNPLLGTTTEDSLTKYTPKKYDFKNTSTKAGKALNWLESNAGEIMRAAPLLNAFDKIERAPQTRRERLGNTYKKTPVDEAQLQRIAENEYGNLTNALRDVSGGSAGTLRSNLLGASLAKNKALNDAYMKAQDINRQEQAQANMFNLRRDVYNMQQSNLDLDDKRMDEAAYQTAKSAKRAALLEDVGAIGKEIGDKKIVKKMFGYTWDGKYWKKGNEKLTDTEMAEKRKTMFGFLGRDSKKYGGYTKQRRR